MTVRERPIERPRQPLAPPALAETMQDFPWKKAVAVAVWGIGAACTQATIAMGVKSALLSWLLALLFQAAMSFAESPIWRRSGFDDRGDEYARPFGLASVICVLFDAGFNIGGIWPYVKGLHTWPPVVAVGEMFGTTVPPLQGVVALLVCALIGALIAAVPEKLFYDND